MGDTAKVFAPVLQHQAVVDFKTVPSYLFLVVGIFVFNLPRFVRSEPLPRTAEARLKVVRTELRAKRLTRDEAHALYKQVLEEELANLLTERQLQPKPPRKPKGPRETATA